MTFACHAEPFQKQTSMSLHSNCLEKIVWHMSNQIKYVFLKASNIVLFPMQIWKAFLPNLEVPVPINFEGRKINNLAPLF